MRSWLYPQVLGLSLLCASCINQGDFEVDSVALNPTLNIPLAHGNLTLVDILNDRDSSHFRTGEDGLLYVTYSDELVSEDIREMFSIPDLPVDRSFVLPGMVIPPHNDDIKFDSIQTTANFGLNPEKLSEIALNAGQISYSVTLTPSSSKLDYEVHLVLPGYVSRATNKPLNAVLDDQGVIDISDYVLSLNDNKFDLKLVMIIKKSSKSTTITPATAVNVELNFEDLGFDYIKGFLGDQETAMQPRNVALSFFDTDLFGNAEVSLADPRVSITVVNENGVPCTVYFNTLEGRKKGAAPIQITVSPASPVALQFPTVMGDTKATTLNVVNVKDLMNYAPSEIFYQADVHVNEGLTSGDNFMIDSSAMKVRLNVDVPLWGRASGIALQDTLNVDLSDVESSEVISASLNLDLINQFPLDGNIQFVLTDDQYVPLGTLLLPEQTDIIKGSTIDADGELQSPGEYSETIELDKGKIENLFKAKHLIVMVNLQTSMNPTTDVKFMASYGLSVKAGVSASLKLSVE